MLIMDLKNYIPACFCYVVHQGNLYSVNDT